MKHIFVVNPIAGKGKAQHGFCESVKTYFAETGGDFDIYITRAPWDATNYVRHLAAEGSRYRFYACGGDGTLLEVLNGAFGFDNAEIAMIPLGSGNDFIRTLGEKKSFLDLKNQVFGVAKPIDIIRCGDRVAINLCSMGFDAEVGANQVRFKRWPLINGSLAYYLSLAYCFFGRTSFSFEISIDGGRSFSGDYVFALAGNGRFYGGGFMGAPLAELTDGLLDFVLVSSIPRRRILSLLGKFRKGGILQYTDICKMHRGSRMTVRSKKPSAVNTDGECSLKTEATFEIIPRGIMLSLPVNL